MNSPSKALRLLVLGIVWGKALAVLGAPPEKLFSVVPKGDTTYAQLRQLSDAGLLTPGEAEPPLSRYDVAKRVLEARGKYDQMVVAQALVPSSRPAQNPVGSPTPTANPVSPAGKTLATLEDAYRYELEQVVQAKIQEIQKEANDFDAQQYALRKKLVGVEEFPTIAVHGLGRAFGGFQLFTGDLPSYVNKTGSQISLGYLDLNPEGVVSKEVSWNFILRLESPLDPNAVPTITFRRATMEFNPNWMTATLGDFDESYTPLTLWNRNTLDLRWVPEMMARQDDIAKYEGFLNNEPDWPFRGLRIGTSVMWPDSQVFEGAQASAFGDMLRSNTIDYGLFITPAQTADWVFGGKAAVQSRKWYWQGATWQADVEAYGLILDQPLDTDPSIIYDPLNASTWLHQYILGSVKPGLKVGLGGDTLLGAAVELANASYQDDKLNPNRITSDNALMGGPYIQFGDSRITLNFLRVGPYYYSPMAQTRQDAVTNLSNPASLSYLTSSGLFTPALRGQFFLTAVPRAGEIFGFYDRTQDNTFPYGFATPNREGTGLEMDIRVLDHQALRLLGSAYLVQEIQDDLVVNSSFTQTEPVDAPAGTSSVPMRQFTYVNAGPSFNLGPSIGWERDLEIGANFRMEQTTSVLGTLTSTWILGGVRADLTKVWEVSVAVGNQAANGTEEGYNGTLWARYPYLFDYSDYGQYSPFTVNGSNQSLMLSNVLRFNRNSALYLDLDWTSGDLLPVNPSSGTLSNQFYEVTYEVKF